MGDYAPIAATGTTFTFTADQAVTGGQVVEVGAADMNVRPGGTGSDKWVGVAAQDAAVNANFDVWVRGPIHRLQAVGAIARGDLVVVDASVVAGRVKTSAAEGAGYVQADANRNARQLLGLALENIADTAFGRVMFIN